MPASIGLSFALLKEGSPMSVKFKDYYEVLGVDRKASQDQIKRAYRKLAQKYHPDVNKTPEAERKIKEINEAYEVLKDPDKREKYDQFGADYKNGQEFRPPPGFEGFNFEFGGPEGGFRMGSGGGGFSDFFEMLFGQARRGGRGAGGGSPFDEAMHGARQRRAGPRKGPDATAEVTVTLEDVYHGSSREIALQVDGQVRRLNVKIPPGVTDGSVIRLAGQGGHGQAGGEAGDLLLTVRIAAHPRYEVTGSDLTCDLKLAPWEAALGEKIDVPTLDGDVTLTIPPGAQSGQKLRLRHRGLPKRGQHGDGQRGDLYVRLMIVVPKTLSDEERKLFEKLKQVSPFNPRA
jgi:curved DNA-binding protein